jgi:hypothetical protein
VQVIDPLELAWDADLCAAPGLAQDLTLIRTVTLGTPLAIETLWERLGIGERLRQIGRQNKLTVPYERALLAMVANRLCEPQSKLGVWDHWLSRVYLPSCQGLKLAQMYEAMDLLYEHAAEVEEQTFFQTANLFNLKVDLIFYDTTTASFSIDQEDEEGEGGGDPLRLFGRPKDGAWSVQVVVALAVTADGVPVRSWVFPGNTADVSTVEKVRTDLRGWQLGRAIFVADSGMNSSENRDQLSRACGKYLLATRLGSVAEIKRDVLSSRGRYQVIKDNLRVKEVIVGDGERRRRYILCFNPWQAERQRKHRAEVVQWLEAELDTHPDRKATARWAIELLASGRYKRYLTVTKTDQIRIDRGAIREAARYDGKWVLETNDDSITVQDAACGYKGLMVIERCFRSLKRTQIKMSPMYHWTPRRIIAHVKICVLSLLIERVAELACGQPWTYIRRSLEELQISYFRTTGYEFYRRNELPSKARNILKKLDIPTPKLIDRLEKLPLTAP